MQMFMLTHLHKSKSSRNYQRTRRRELCFGVEGKDMKHFNTNMELELNNLAKFMHMAVDYAKEIGFTGQF